MLVVGVGLIAWRGDRLRSPGGFDSPASREGAFLLNNLLFVGFAFVVLLGTVFPLLYEAFRGQQVTVGAPYFDTMTVPIGLALLVLMAIGPALPWRKTTVETLAPRLVDPRVDRRGRCSCGCVAAGVRGLGRPDRLRPRRVRRGRQRPSARAVGASPRRRHGVGAWRGLVGRANGGMVVHLGVVVIAVALAAATSFGHRGEVTLRPGTSATFDGHRLTFEGVTQVRSPPARPPRRS